MKELVYSSLLLAILFKVLFALKGIYLPINLSLIILPLLIFFIVRYGVQLKLQNIPYINLVTVISLMVFWSWMVITSIYSPANKYKVVKSLLFLVNILLFVYPIIVPLNYRRLFKQIIIIATVIEPILFVFIPLLLFGDIEGSKSYYLALGEISGTILLFYLVLLHKNYIKFSLSHLFIIFIHLFILFLNPARGPIIFTLIMIFIWGITHTYRFFELKVAFVSSGILVLIGGILLLVFTTFPEYGNFLLERMSKLIHLVISDDTSLMGVSTYQRIVFWEYSIKMIFADWFHFIFGYGVGSFGTLFKGIDGRLYPHNMFLETWFEMGIIGFGLLIIFGIMYLLAILRKGNVWLLIPLGVPFLDAMKSFSLSDLRILFGVMGILLNFVYWEKLNDSN